MGIVSQAITEIEDTGSMLPGFLPAAQTVNHQIQLAAALLDKRIATARSFPRSIARFKGEATELLKTDIDTARSAEYAKPVGGGKVVGPSVRLAELVAMCWQNLDITVEEPVATEKTVSAKASAWDLQRNLRQEAVVTTSILNKNGNRYPQHLIETAGMACQAKARRNAILAVIPRAYINDLLEVAREVVKGNQEPLEVTRKKMLEFFSRSYKVSEEQICKALDVAGVDDITQKGIDDLRLIANGLKEGEPLEAFFEPQTTSRLDGVKQKIQDRRGKGGDKPAEKKPADKPPESPTEQPGGGKLFGDGPEKTDMDAIRR
jgi:hypothetical protein